LACPVQRFLVAVCLQKDGTGFINVREVTPWISKLEYGIRCTVWMELQRRIKEEGIEVDQDLGGMKAFIKAGNQTPFGFLKEIKHLAVSIAGTTSALPQVFLFYILSDCRLSGLARKIIWPITIILLVNPSLTVTASLIWGLWGLQMAGDAWSPQMAVSEPPWLLVNPTGPNSNYSQNSIRINH